MAFHQNRFMGERNIFWRVKEALGCSDQFVLTLHNFKPFKIDGELCRWRHLAEESVLGHEPARRRQGDVTDVNTAGEVNAGQLLQHALQRHTCKHTAWLVHELAFNERRRSLT